MLAAIDWCALKQRPHHLAEQFAQRGLDVLFVENTGTRVPTLRDLPRIGTRLKTAWLYSTPAPEVPRGVTVLSPLLPPLPYTPFFVQWSVQHMLARIQTHLRAKGILAAEAALILYMATPLALELAQEIPWNVVTYDVLTDPKQVDGRVAGSEDSILAKADRVLFASEALWRQYGQIAKGLVFRDGFPLSLAASQAPSPPNFLSLPRPRLLYLGGINRKVWAEAVAALCDAVPQGSVSLVGPLDMSAIHLPKRKNLHVFGPVAEYSQLAGLLRAADAGIVPYFPDAYGGRMHPAKLAEYTLFGLPTIAVATEEMARLQAIWPSETMYLADQLSRFPQAVHDALSEDSPARRAERVAFAHGNSWQQRAGALLAELERVSASQATP